MAYYAETTFPELNQENRSLIVAYANLLKELGYDHSPPDVAKVLNSNDASLNWYSLPRSFSEIILNQTSEGDVWPLDRHAIIRQRRLDRKAAGMVEHYSLVADSHAGTIIDSLDGEIKHASVYGGVMGWASYKHESDDVFDVEVIEELDLAPERPGQRYRLERDETIWTVARKFKVSATKLMDHNEVTDPKTVTAGMWLYIPKHDAVDRPDIEYKILANPRPMHVTKQGGTTKWRFGNVRKWADIRQEAKHYREGANVDIYAVAKVPVEGEIAAYYMDRHDLGSKFQETGRPAYTRGFNWQHLGEGHVAPETKKEPELIAEAVAAAMLEDDRQDIPSPEPSTIAVEGVIVKDEQPVADEPQDAVAVPGELPEDYKDTFKYLNVEESSERFRLLEAIDIREMDGALPTVHRKEGDIFLSRGWFMHEGTPYYRLDTKYWYGIPTQYAVSIENEAFTVDMSLPERVRYGSHLTPEERRMVMVAKAAAKYNKFRTLAGMLRRK